ncbi:hypothetical protein SDC9_07998 [bioreactor metagenome]|uniref:Type 4 fimbrial biogenesis protein PilX N-terminal domain-containing protein n=1 Tax=bioreactor metagenome TaxID=1076179 RepID=A0A644T632_9ZZZZ|nr:pilus assembly PilX N-terminal domain-containing protein [Candidatus Elulimicrobiales bacterium]
MKDKIFNKKQNNKKNKTEPGYILIMTLVLSAVILSIALTIARILEKEMLFSRIVANNREAYFAADSGLECAQYIDNVFRDNSKGVSLFLNRVNVNAKQDFDNNALTNVFFATSSIPNAVTYANNFKTRISCASRDGTYNQVFKDTVDASSAGYVTNRNAVISNLANQKSSYYIVGDTTQATTTFGLIIKEKDSNNKDITRCVLVDFYKKHLPSSVPGQTLLTGKYSILSTGYSSCDLNNKNTVSRTILRDSSN